MGNREEEAGEQRGAGQRGAEGGDSVAHSVHVSSKYGSGANETT